MQATARAHANIALVKYWGKADTATNAPAVGSLSIGLEGLTTTTHVAELDAPHDTVSVGDESRGPAVERVIRFLDVLRREFGSTARFSVTSTNNFPTGAGLASSASGFAALTLAVAAVAGSRSDDARVLSGIARQGSGSAARSVYGGFVRMSAGDDATALPLHEATHWPLDVHVAICSREAKTIGSTEGMMLTAQTSPFYAAWLESQPRDLDSAEAAIARKDFEALARVSEASCLRMHGLMLSADPGLIYWQGATVEVVRAVRALRAAGTPAFFTIDAGPQVKVVCEPAASAAVAAALDAVPGVLSVIHTRVGGAPSVKLQQ